jgi:hypothetical protein
MYLRDEDEERWSDLTAVREHAAYLVNAIRKVIR